MPFEVHVAGDLVDRVVPADILHIEQRPVLLAQHAAMDRAGRQIKARRGVDLAASAHRARRSCSTASGSSRISSNFSIRSPNTVPWAQPEVSVFFFSLSSKSVSRSVRTTTVSISSS